MPKGPDRSSERTHSRSGTPVTSVPGWMFCEASTWASPVPTYCESLNVQAVVERRPGRHLHRGRELDAARVDAAGVEVGAAAGNEVVGAGRGRGPEEEDAVVEVDVVPGGAEGDAVPRVAHPHVDVRGRLGLEGGEAAPRHLEQPVGQRLEVLGIAREQLEAVDRGSRGVTPPENSRSESESTPRPGVDAEQVAAGHVHQELLDAARDGEGAGVDGVFDVPLEDLLRESPSRTAASTASRRRRC